MGDIWPFLVMILLALGVGMAAGWGLGHKSGAIDVVRGAYTCELKENYDKTTYWSCKWVES